ncbi:putative ABC transport system permease protein [Silvibacterium bohemicum]|uniref:Putative ABC transport system permease protein n=1 Tax=Silvibacterium bohemicum TaxID=1577686 RepID=A0A841JX05_9BACT|nr:FtsX-like permease family protein [Silvibacterium bohemicum]MBB6145943.1 putative ABC transport system permease protein [Silvibacterium bohemicum]
MNKLVIGNLLHRPLRTLISVVAVAIEVVMILSIVAVMVGQVSNASRQTGGIGADIIMRPPNASFISSVGGAPVPAKIAEVLRKLPHVAVAAPAITDFNMAGGLETIWGIDFQSFNALRPFVFLSGGPFTGPNDVMVDDLYARSAPKNSGPRVVGATIQVLNHPFRISGIVEHGKGGRVFLPIRTLGALMGSADNASLFYIKSDDLKNQDLIRNEIHATPGLSQYQVQTVQEFFSQMTPDHLPGFNIALRAVIGIAVIVGFLVIFQSMYTAVLERTREIGILKSLGASKTYIVNVVLRETALVTIAGIIAGILLAEALRLIMAYRFPTLPFPITAEWRLRGAVIALVGSILGAIYPAWKAARKDPIDALAYE